MVSIQIPGKKLEVSLGISGGGCKAFFALGIGYKLRGWGVQIREVSGVSAGSAMALCILSETEEETVEYFEELVKRNKSNFKLSNLLFGQRAFPHENMYRRTIRFGMDFDKILKSGAKLYIHSIRAKPKAQERDSFLYVSNLIPQTMQAYLLDERDRENGNPHPNRVHKILAKWNMEDAMFTEKDIKNPKVLEQIILNSSSVPPVVSFQKLNDEYYLDGGLTNNMVLETFSGKFPMIGIYYDDTTLADKDPRILKRALLIRPDGKLPVNSFDYTNAKGVRAAYELGKQKAEQRKEEILEFLRTKKLS